MSDSPKEKIFPCDECLAGMMRMQYITYFTWLSEELVTVPNFPAWICDVCGRREYDERAIGWLSAMLSPDAGRPTAKPRRRRPPMDKREPVQPAPE